MLPLPDSTSDLLSWYVLNCLFDIPAPGWSPPLWLSSSGSLCDWLRTSPPSFDLLTITEPRRCLWYLATFACAWVLSSAYHCFICAFLTFKLWLNQLLGDLLSVEVATALLSRLVSKAKRWFGFVPVVRLYWSLIDDLLFLAISLPIRKLFAFYVNENWFPDRLSPGMTAFLSVLERPFLL